MNGSLSEDTSFSLISENAFFQSTKGLINFNCMPGNLLVKE